MSRLGVREKTFNMQLNQSYEVLKFRESYLGIYKNFKIHILFQVAC